VRLYERARAGEEVEVPARPITVHEAVVLGVELPRVRIRFGCSKGTYVRVLISELGEALGCGAHLFGARPHPLGSFTLADALPLAEVKAQAEAGTLRLRGLSEALAHLTLVPIEPELEWRVRAGQKLQLRELASLEGEVGNLPEGSMFRAVASTGALLASGKRSWTAPSAGCADSTNYEDFRISRLTGGIP